MSATRLPDGSVVMRPSGQRAVTPKGNGTAARRPAVAVGGGSGTGGRAAAVRSPQPGRVPVPKNAYR